MSCGAKTCHFASKGDGGIVEKECYDMDTGCCSENKFAMFK